MAIATAIRYGQTKDDYVSPEDRIPIERPRFDLHENPVQFINENKQDKKDEGIPLKQMH